MTRATRWMLILCFMTATIAVSWDFTPRSAGRDQAKGNAASSLMQKQGGNRQSSTAGKSAKQGSKSGEKANAESEDPDPEADDDPDLPPGMTGRVDKEAYLRARGDYFDMLRGREGDVAEGARERAILQMERQEKQLKSRPAASSVRSFVNITDWAFIGPNPIPLGPRRATPSMPCP